MGLFFERKPNAPPKSKKFWISVGLEFGVVLLFAVGLLTWNRTLRHRVEDKTPALKRKVIEHQMAQKAIQESENRYRQIIENTKKTHVLVGPN